MGGEGAVCVCVEGGLCVCVCVWVVCVWRVLCVGWRVGCVSYLRDKSFRIFGHNSPWSKAVTNYGPNENLDLNTSFERSLYKASIKLVKLDQ